jgi:predicted RNase H-like HicB family nuclease
MKTLEYYLSLPYRIEIIPDQYENGYTALYPELPGCISTGDTVEEALKNIADAKKEWLKAALESNVNIAEPDSLAQYSGQFKIRMPKSLHKSLAERSKQEGISMNQYCIYLLSKEVYQ